MYYSEVEQLFLLLLCVYLGCLLTFCIWYIKFGIDEAILRATVNKAKIVEEKLNKFDSEVQDIKSRINEMDRNNLSLQDIQLLYYVHESAPVVKKYKDELEKEIVNITYQMEKYSIRLEETLKVLNTFLGIISFGLLKFTNKEEFY